MENSERFAICIRLLNKSPHHAVDISVPTHKLREMEDILTSYALVFCEVGVSSIDTSPKVLSFQWIRKLFGQPTTEPSVICLVGTKKWFNKDDLTGTMTSLTTLAVARNEDYLLARESLR